jgi:hypothetical protein
MPKSTVDWDAAVEKAMATDRWTEIIMRAITKKVANRWKFVSFRGKSGREWRGIVDVLAIRKDTTKPNKRHLKNGDLFDIMLIQMKGGSAKSPTENDKRRLREVAKYYHAKNIVLYEWIKGKKSQFYIMKNNLEWEETTSSELFG